MSEYYTFSTYKKMECDMNVKTVALYRVRYALQITSQVSHCNNMQ